MASVYEAVQPAITCSDVYGLISSRIRCSRNGERETKCSLLLIATAGNGRINEIKFGDLYKLTNKNSHITVSMIVKNHNFIKNAVFLRKKCTNFKVSVL